MLRRQTARQVDILEFLRSQAKPVAEIRQLRLREEKGFVAYAKDARDFFKEYSDNKAKRKAMTPAERKKKEIEDAKSDIGIAVQQQFESLELLKKMKWKRVTWEKDADYSGFARRILDNDSIFASVPAFSHMSLHVVRDKAARPTVAIESSINTFKLGDLTSWFLEERDPAKVHGFFPTTERRRGPFTVDWVAGEARILDSISTFEMHTFLVTTAHRLQALQVQMAAEQEKMTADLEAMRLRIGAPAIVFNKGNASFWDDPQRTKDPEYVTPADIRLFLDGMGASSLLFWLKLRGHQIRIVPSGRPFKIVKESREIHIPADFQKYNCDPAHARYQALERVMSVFRTFWWFWFCLGLMLVGDVEVI